jgi:hypothetical protein
LSAGRLSGSSAPDLNCWEAQRRVACGSAWRCVRRHHATMKGPPSRQQPGTIPPPQPPRQPAPPSSCSLGKVPWQGARHLSRRTGRAGACPPRPSRAALGRCQTPLPVLDRCPSKGALERCQTPLPPGPGGRGLVPGRPREPPLLAPERSQTALAPALSSSPAATLIPQQEPQLDRAADSACSQEGRFRLLERWRPYFAVIGDLCAKMAS